MFQSPQMKLLNFEQFQSMLNQIQISQLSDSSISPKSRPTSQTSYLILNKHSIPKQTNRKGSHSDAVNANSTQFRMAIDSKTPSQRGLSPMSCLSTLPIPQPNQQSNENQSLRPSNSNKSIGVYSSRLSQLSNQQQQIQQKMHVPLINPNLTIDQNSGVINTAPSFNTVEADYEYLPVQGASYERVDETLQMKELSCSLQDEEEEQEDNHDSCQDYYEDEMEQYPNYGYCITDIPSQLDRTNQCLINTNFNNNNNNKNNPTISSSNSQRMLDPLLQNLNVKKMCEVQKHFCKKRIREFKQPCEDIVQYQEFIKMVNERSSKENTLSQPSNRRIKTDHSVNSIRHQHQQQQQQQPQLQHKPPIHHHNGNNTVTLASQQLNCINTRTQNSNNLLICNTEKQQQIQNLTIPHNILKQQQNNHIQNAQNCQNTYSELTSKVFKMKKKTQPSIQDNIVQSIAQNNTSYQQQFNSNKENNASNIGINRNSIKNNNNINNINNSYNFNNTSSNIQQINQSVVNGSRDSSVCNYESRNTRSGIASSKNQQKVNTLPSAVLNCPNIVQQPQFQQNQKQKSLSPFYSKGLRQEKELKNILSREQRANSNISYSNRNNPIFNNNTNQSTKGNSTINAINLSSLLNTSNALPPPISSRSRLSTVEVHDRNNFEGIHTIQSHTKNNSLSIGRQNVSKSSDVVQNYSLSHSNNVQNKNIVTFGQSYYKRQQQQAFKAQKNFKHLNFNCLGYIRKYKEILEGCILPGISRIPKDDTIELQHAYKQSVIIMSDQIELTNNEDLNNYQDFLSLRSKNIFNQFLAKYGITIQI